MVLAVSTKPNFNINKFITRYKWENIQEIPNPLR